MADTITALDTATTDELIAALIARHRAVLGESAGHLAHAEQVRYVVNALAQELGDRLSRAINAEQRRFIQGHPAIPATPDPPPTPFWFQP